MTGRGAWATFEAEVITHKEEHYAHLSKVEKQREDHAHIVSSIEEAKVVATSKVENIIHRMETLRKELAKPKVEFNELKRNETRLDQLEAEAHATAKQ